MRREFALFVTETVSTWCLSFCIKIAKNINVSRIFTKTIGFLIDIVVGRHWNQDLLKKT